MSQGSRQKFARTFPKRSHKHCVVGILDIGWLVSGKCKILIFWRVSSFYLHALCILSADDSGRFLQNPREVAQIVGRQNGQSSKRSELYTFQISVNCGPRGGTQGAEPGSEVQRFWGPLGASEFDPSFQQFGVSETPFQGPLRAPESLSERGVRFQRSGKTRWATWRPLRGPVFPDAPSGGSNPRAPTFGPQTIWASKKQNVRAHGLDVMVCFSYLSCTG